MSRLQKRLLGDMGRAIRDFDLIGEGDRIMVAVSGGKDSLTLLDLLTDLSHRSPAHFSLVAVNLDQGQPGFDAKTLGDWLASTGLEHHMLQQDTFSIVKRLTTPGKSFCPVCSRLRRGILYNAAVELKCNKIALGHHRDDLIETLLLSELYSGAIKSMPPKLVSDDGRNTIIRPLAYCVEAEIAAYAEERHFPIIPCNLCSSQENQRRRKVKELIAALAADHPAVPGNLLNALGNVLPSHLLDPSLSSSRAVPRDEEESFSASSQVEPLSADQRKPPG
jgi:tRNA 2-thiocytidine biosynthesis protein TtcA